VAGGAAHARRRVSRGLRLRGACCTRAAQRQATARRGASAARGRLSAASGTCFAANNARSGRLRPGARRCAQATHPSPRRAAPSAAPCASLRRCAVDTRRRGRAARQAAPHRCDAARAAPRVERRAKFAARARRRVCPAPPPTRACSSLCVLSGAGWVVPASGRAAQAPPYEARARASEDGRPRSLCFGSGLTRQEGWALPGGHGAALQRYGVRRACGCSRARLTAHHGAMKPRSRCTRGRPRTNHH
jgi:hypothetical protein